MGIKEPLDQSIRIGRSTGLARLLTMPESKLIKAFIGQDVDVDRLDGRQLRGLLVNASRRSLWLVEDDEDVMIPLTLVADLRLAS